MPEQIVGVADLGSNSARLVLFRVYPDQTYHVIDEHRVRVRLAEHLDEQEHLSDEGRRRALETARAFAQLCEERRATRLLAVATGAMRFARNGPEIVLDLERETGLRIEIISGEREAFLGYLGVIHTLGIRDATVLDVGGGSAQVTRVIDRRAAEMTSMPLGALTLTRAYLDRDQITGEQLAGLEAHLAASFASLPWLAPEGIEEASLPAEMDGSDSLEYGDLTGPETPAATGVKNGCASLSNTSGAVLVGLGGTVRNLGRIYQRQVSYPLDLLHGLVVPIDALGEIYRMVASMTLAERKDVAGLTQARADNIVAGAAAVHSLAEAIGARELVVSGHGIREGLFLQSVRGGASDVPFAGGPAIYAAANLMRRFEVNQAHARHVAMLALSLFDQLSRLHGLGPDERRLLQLAALLHDIGIAVSYYKHAAHGFHLLTRAGVEGLTHRELVVVALLVAAHGGQSTPHKQWPAFRSLLEARDLGMLAKLGTLLHLCECLDRGEAGRVRSVACQYSPDGAEVGLQIATTGEAALEIHEANAALSSLQKAYGVRFTLPDLG